MLCSKSASETLFSLFISTVFVLCNSAGNIDISVSIFLEESNSDLEEIVHNAIDRYSYDHENSSLENHIRLNFSLVSYNRMMDSILSLEQHHSTSLRSAIFVHVSKHEMGMSSIMERSNIGTIGLFQTDGILTTQVGIILLLVFFLINILTSAKELIDYITFTTQVYILHWRYINFFLLAYLYKTTTILSFNRFE